MSFTGTGAEYFRIWIVNLLLSVVTLGIYSAWAKVRRLQYFYRHTHLAGSSFDYHGNPLALLRGRIIGASLLAIYYSAGYFSPLLGLSVMAGLAVVFPWLLARSLRFRLYNSSYRGIRFHFHGSLSQAYGAFLGYGIASICTLMILGPLWHHRIKRYEHGEAAYGQTRFTFAAPVGEFYVTYIAAIFLAVGIFTATAMIMFLVGGLAFSGARPTGGSPFSTGAGVVVVWVFIVGYLSAAMSIRAFIEARLQNHIWNNTWLGEHRFNYRLRSGRLFTVLFSNFVFTLFTVGLYLPFAQIELARFHADAFELLPSGSLDDFTAGTETESSAIGEETSALFDFDIAF